MMMMVLVMMLMMMMMMMMMMHLCSRSSIPPRVQDHDGVVKVAAARSPRPEQKDSDDSDPPSPLGDDGVPTVVCSLCPRLPAESG
jgi:hypothetical protein